jgi:hypothetical protein
LHIIAVLIMIYQNATVAFYVTIPVAVNANHRMVGEFVTDA